MQQNHYNVLLKVIMPIPQYRSILAHSFRAAGKNLVTGKEYMMRNSSANELSLLRNLKTEATGFLLKMRLNILAPGII
jgi:hypothetical protein